MLDTGNIIIRKYTAGDRTRVRDISCSTSFLEMSREQIFSDDEILADSLTLYFTDYEPESCFVAVTNNKVIGYIIGSKEVAVMNRIINSRIISHLFIKSLQRKLFFKWVNLRFFFYNLKSLLKREFFMPDFSKEFPATLHINIDKTYRGQGIGEKLIETYLTYLKQEEIRGVYFGTLSEGARRFFAKMNFNILFQSKRTYLKPYLGEEINFYVFGKKL